MKAGIGIASYNGANRVDELLSSLEEHTNPIDGGYEICVLDDGGKESNFAELVEVCESYGVELPLRHETNLGIPTTWNDLTRHFDSEYMVLLNDDLVLVDGWLDSLLYFAENNKFGTAGLPMYSPKKTGKPHSGWKKIKHGWKPYLAFPRKKPLRVPAAPGPCFIFKRTLFDFVGGFDTRYMSFYEEIDFSLNLAQCGYASYILPCPWIYHYWARSFAENPELMPRERMDISRAKFIEKWGGQLEIVYSKVGQVPERQRLKWLLDGEEKRGLEKPFKPKFKEAKK